VLPANELTRLQYSFFASNSLFISITSIFGQGENASVEVQMRTTVKTLKMKLLHDLLSENGYFDIKQSIKAINEQQNLLKPT
tara:strand:- start:445 stop:690 length:246 start_codon:yes stop_codon:yes gene_type:complete